MLETLRHLGHVASVGIQGMGAGFSCINRIPAWKPNLLYDHPHLPLKLKTLASREPAKQYMSHSLNSQYPPQQAPEYSPLTSPNMNIHIYIYIHLYIYILYVYICKYTYIYIYVYTVVWLRKKTIGCYSCENYTALVSRTPTTHLCGQWPERV